MVVASIIHLFATATAIEAIYITQKYGGLDNDEARSVVQTVDGGYALAGSTGSFGAGTDDFWLVKVDASGNHEWNQKYGGLDNDEARSVVQTVDGGYALAGVTGTYFARNSDFWLVKTDSSGNHEWNQTYGGKRNDEVRSVVQTVDGGYALAGYTNSFGAGGGHFFWGRADFWLVKTDEAGNMQWSKTYGGLGNERAYSMVLTVDGGYALAGSITYSGEAFNGSFDFWLVKTDASGNHEWNQTYGGQDHDETRSVIQTVDGGYALAGQTVSFGAGSTDFWLVKTDSSGNHEWNQTYGGPNGDEAYSVVQTVDGGYVLAGYTSSFGAGSTDFWLVKTDSSGNHEWNQTYGGPNIDSAHSVVQTVDGGYALAGKTGIWARNSDFWLVKTDEFGFIPEFPTWTLILLIVILLAVIISTVTITIYRRKLFKTTNH